MGPSASSPCRLTAHRAAALALTVALASCGPAETAPPADLVIVGDAIYTGRPGPERVAAVAVRDGAIIFAGEREGAAALSAPTTNQIDLDATFPGAAMFPGFTDAHMHLDGVGRRETTLNLEGAASLADVVAMVAGAAAASGGGPVFGGGWIETRWPEQRTPTRADLDAAHPGAPVLLTRADGHAMVVNSAALAAAGIDATTPDPAGGRIERGAAGEPTGLLIDRAMDLVAALEAEEGEDALRRHLMRGAGAVAAYGWTGVHNMSVSPKTDELIRAMSDGGEIPIRVYNSLTPDGLETLAVSGPRTSENGRVVTRAVKMYVDGALGSRGAALAAPYADAPETDGLLLLEADTARAAFETALENGVQMNVHAIGDRANSLLLDWFEAAFIASPDAERASDGARWRVEHAQILDPADIPRFAVLGVIASMQPSHAIGDLHFAPTRLGEARLDGAYAWRSLLETGAVIAGGSDAPVERGDPLIEFYAAVARRDLGGFQGENWRPQEALEREAALALFTSAPAYASFAEDRLGSIEVGKRADFSVFSVDLMTAPAADIPKGAALLTIVDGEIVFDARTGGTEPAR